jgi:hypothetical protein
MLKGEKVFVVLKKAVVGGGGFLIGDSFIHTSEIRTPPLQRLIYLTDEIVIIGFLRMFGFDVSRNFFLPPKNKIISKNGLEQIIAVVSLCYVFVCDDG